jgi:hypothetical protein
MTWGWYEVHPNLYNALEFAAFTRDSKPVLFVTYYCQGCLTLWQERRSVSDMLHEGYRLVNVAVLGCRRRSVVGLRVLADSLDLAG